MSTVLRDWGIARCRGSTGNCGTIMGELLVGRICPVAALVCDECVKNADHVFVWSLLPLVALTCIFLHGWLTFCGSLCVAPPWQKPSIMACTCTWDSGGQNCVSASTAQLCSSLLRGTHHHPLNPAAPRPAPCPAAGPQSCCRRHGCRCSNTQALCESSAVCACFSSRPSPITHLCLNSLVTHCLTPATPSSVSCARL